MNPPRTTITVSGPATLDRLPLLLESVGEVCDAAGADQVVRHDLRLAVEEACVNIMRHAYQGGVPGDMTLEVASEARKGRPAIRVTLQDHGHPFDPLTIAAPPEGSDAELMPLGGLGVFLMRQVADVLSYRHDAKAGNQLTLVKFLAPREGEEP